MNKEILKLLIEKIRNNDYNAFSIFVEENPKSIDYRLKTHNTTLCYALRNYCQSIKIIKVLFNEGKNINIQNDHGDTPLILAIRYCSSKIRYKVVKLLIEEGAYINVFNNLGMSALMYAIEKLDMKIINLLIEHGANINTFNKNNVNAISFLIYKSNTSIDKYLLKMKIFDLFYIINKQLSL